MFPEGAHLARGVYAEDGGVAVPLGAFDPNEQKWGVLLRRVDMDGLGLIANPNGTTVASTTVNDHASW